MIVSTRPRTLVPLEGLHNVAQSGRAPGEQVDWADPIDHRKWFLCETLTPLFYTAAYALLTPPQKLRYNQLVGMSFNEVIAFFEESLAGSVLATLARDRHTPESLQLPLADFQGEESEHTAIFRHLNRLAAPDWYATRPDFLVRFPARAHRLVRLIGGHPRPFTFILWVMLAMEERSLEISQRIAAVPPERIEPHFAAVYRAHRRDEARHVQIDWHLIETFHTRLSRPMRIMNAHLFARAVRSFLIAPRRAGHRVVAALAAEFPELRPQLALMQRQLAALANNRDYQQTLFSAQATPILFRLMDQFPEFHLLRHTLLCYPEVAQ